MIEVELEKNLWNREPQEIVRKTAESLDILRHPSFIDQYDKARDFLAERTSPFVSSIREGFSEMGNDLNQEDFLRVVEEAKKLPSEETYPLNMTYIQKLKSYESARLAYVIFSFVPSPLRPTSNPAHYLSATRNMQENIDAIAGNQIDVREMVEDEDFSFALTMTFFRTGRRIPFKQIESAKEKKERVVFELETYLEGFK